MKGVFITGTDTGVGKTIVSAAIMAASPPTVGYWKPLQTGPDEDSDSASVQRLAAIEPSRILNLGYRFPIPASPHYAAAAENQVIDLDWLCDIAKKHHTDHPAWVVEGVGGLMVPLSPEVLLPTFIKRLGLPVLVVSSTRLGTINHTLLTIRQLESLNIPTLGIVMVGDKDPSATSAIHAHSDAPIIAYAPHLQELTPQSLTEMGRGILDHEPLHQLLGKTTH